MIDGNRGVRLCQIDMLGLLVLINVWLLYAIDVLGLGILIDVFGWVWSMCWGLDCWSMCSVVCDRCVRLCAIDVLDTNVHDDLQVGWVEVIRRIEPLVLCQQRQQPTKVRC